MPQAATILITEIENLKACPNQMTEEMDIEAVLRKVHSRGLTAIKFLRAIDYPDRFQRSRDVGAHLGLMPRKYASGEAIGMALFRGAAM
ncbi:hypothetical protein CQ12_41320 [Bradyrhizobium jicamae]|uniref:Transposase IS116/IS110/IS902 C-terminal domain-containing protein n=1 Tax=Bradyrhizobium jicamae TaxID=280332 RepID=A0A0R3LBQ6_9BRAD|nr:hypothetical protein CQ12_41320 [Bradyrhizobium jicamae]